MKYSIVFVAFAAYSLMIMAALNHFPGSFGAKSIDSVADMVFGFAAMIVASIFASAYLENKRPELIFLAAGAVVLALSKITQIYLQQWQAAADYTITLDTEWTLSSLVTMMGCILVIAPIWRASG